MNYLSAKAVVFLLCFLAAISIAETPARAETFHVGSTRENKTLNAVLPRLKAGDTVEIDAGIYHETVRLAMNGTREKPITFRGVGASRPVFDARNLDTSGRGTIPRGAFQIEGAHITLEHLEIKNARNGENAAGIRLLDSTGALIRDCHVSGCDMGIFGGDRETVTVEDCDIGFNGAEGFNGYSHNFYMSGNRVVVRRCSIHDALFGQNFKSRAHFNELWFNWIWDSNEGEIGFVDSKGQTDRPNSHALMIGNVLRSKPDRGGNASKFVLFGSESGASHDGTLWMFHNTLIAANRKIQFITLDDAKASLVCANNLFVGSEQIFFSPQPAASVQGARNILPPGAALPDGWSEKPAGALQYLDGEGVSHTLVLESFAAPSFPSQNTPRKTE